MPDRHYTDPILANLYDAFCAGREDFSFYLPLVMDASRVLDVGCGTGDLLRRARDAGHTGRLCGLDPAEAMLDVARRHHGVELVHGTLATVAFDHEFDLAVMTGHAFQVLLTDEELRTALAAVHRALAPGAAFVFETRNPPFRGWRGGGPDVVTVEGLTVSVSGPAPAVEGDFVSFSGVHSSPSWTEPLVSHSTLRFLDAERLQAILAEAGFTVEAQFGDWDRSPLTPESYEIITIARWS